MKNTVFFLKLIKLTNIGYLRRTRSLKLIKQFIIYFFTTNNLFYLIKIIINKNTFNLLQTNQNNFYGSKSFIRLEYLFTYHHPSKKITKLYF